ncbi:S1C family serine protease [Terrabacter sp. MAHUQ-38]|uniref:S1C family serine protease n=1 Tax=unclassified Terrabacter TaxID=2630222 RepID=UPI00165DA122|nr:trypsin-like peptidase domain-containing protein [Terrabacter sp. MAHUQ-38]MBC9821799.1 trypsin-like peptidase domain-containing protein [Terrabacter sp. MAHUQ-38]
MSDEPRTPDPEPTAPPEPTRAVEPEQTGIIDLHDTQAIPREPAPSQPVPAGPQAPSAPRSEDAWFDVFGGEHPADGAGVPARADASWGSDRADALAEKAHRSAYAPPVADEAPVTSSAPAQTSGPVTDPAAVAAPGAEPGATTTQPSGPFGPGPAYAGPVPQAPAGEQPSAAGEPVPPGVLLTDEPRPAGPRKGRGRVVAAVVGLCLLSGVVGGVAGQLAEDRINTGVSTLPEPGPGATQRPPGSIANIAAKVLPSVVTIKVDAGSEGSATGSGFVIDSKGHVLTNNHVVEPGVSGDIEVVLSNGDTEKATIVGRDASYDLAVLKIERTDLTPLQLGPSDKVVVGDQVIAVGAPLGLDQTVTTGIVSALNRPVTPGEGSEASYINAIQTDAAINPGNSGGPLLDLDGRVIGVNSAIARVPGTSGATGGSIGLGFAIPSDQARRTADQLIATGKATHPVIGVKLDRTFTGEGAQVIDAPDAVTAGGPAAKAGVKPGDVIVAFEGKRIRTPDQLIVSIRARAVGDTVSLRVERDGQQLDLRMTLEADPAS